MKMCWALLLVLLLPLLLTTPTESWAQTGAPTMKAPAAKPPAKAPEPTVKEVVKEVKVEVIKRVEVPVPAPVTWLNILAMAINTVGTIIALKIAAWAVPQLREQVPDLVPFLTVLVGPGVALAQNALAKYGIIVNLDPLLAIFSGGAAMAVTMYGLQHKRRVAAKATAVPTKLSRDLAPV